MLSKVSFKCLTTLKLILAITQLPLPALAMAPKNNQVQLPTNVTLISTDQTQYSVPRIFLQHAKLLKEMLGDVNSIGSIPIRLDDKELNLLSNCLQLIDKTYLSVLIQPDLELKQAVMSRTLNPLFIKDSALVSVANTLNLLMESNRLDITPLTQYLVALIAHQIEDITDITAISDFTQSLAVLPKDIANQLIKTLMNYDKQWFYSLLSNIHREVSPFTEESAYGYVFYIQDVTLRQLVLLMKLSQQSGTEHIKAVLADKYFKRIFDSLPDFLKKMYKKKLGGSYYVKPLIVLAGIGLMGGCSYLLFRVKKNTVSNNVQT